MSSLEQAFIPLGGLPPLNQKKSLFFVGIGGVGMAGLAALLHDLGHSVAGSDAQKSEFAKGLERRNIPLYLGHDSKYLSPHCDVVVRTPAVKENNPILVKARESGIPICARGEMLAALFNSRSGVAVAGTHGKTTTSAMMVHMLQALEYDAGYFVGGLSGGLQETSVLGSEKLFITEADESDGSLAGYHAKWGLLTNVEYDHAETFATPDELLACFRRFVGQSEHLIYNKEDPGCCALLSAETPATSFGLNDQADFYAQHLVLQAGTIHFEFIGAEQPIPVTLNVDGLHNALNALAALTFLHCAGLDTARAAASLSSFKAVNRRFELLCTTPRWIISDYAHHPTEIRMAVDSALRLGANTLWVIFQPHRYSRTRALREQFPASFMGADEVVLCPVYAASELPLSGGEHSDLYEAFEPDEGFVVSLADSLNQAWEYVRSRWSDGDALLVAGAGDVEQIASWAMADIEI